MVKTKKQKLIILGGGGNGTVIASAIDDMVEAGARHEILGYLDDGKEKGTILNGHPVLGMVSDAPSYLKHNDIGFIYALITAKKTDERIEKLLRLQIPVARFVTLIHPKASVSRHSQLGCGVIIMPGVVVSPNVSIGNFVLIFANSLVGHDSVLEDYSFVANCVSIGSTVRLKKGAYLGSNSSIREKIVVGENALVGLGAVVIKNVQAGSAVVGNPAKRLS